MLRKSLQFHMWSLSCAKWVCVFWLYRKKSRELCEVSYSIVSFHLVLWSVVLTSSVVHTWCVGLSLFTLARVGILRSLLPTSLREHRSMDQAHHPQTQWTTQHCGEVHAVVPLEPCLHMCVSSPVDWAPQAQAARHRMSKAPPRHDAQNGNNFHAGRPSQNESSGRTIRWSSGHNFWWDNHRSSRTSPHFIPAGPPTISRRWGKLPPKSWPSRRAFLLDAVPQRADSS